MSGLLRPLYSVVRRLWARSVDPQAARAVPVLDRLLRIFFKAPIVGAQLGLDPWCLVAEHEVNALGRLRQGRVDRRGEGVDEIGPSRVEHPQRAPAASAEMTLSRAHL